MSGSLLHGSAYYGAMNPRLLLAAVAAVLSACATPVTAPPAAQAAADRAFDLVITHARILDGTGNPWFRGHVAIQDGRIAAITRGAPPQALRTINARDHIVAPGFIDVHTHVEQSIQDRPTADNYAHGGVTTVITGNCGGSDDDLAVFFKKIDAGTSINVASLIGHNTVRRQVMGMVNRAAQADEIERMQALVQQGMLAGAVGFSSGLIYLPGMFSSTDEISALASVAAAHQGVYATHMRDESNRITQAIDETLDIGRRNRMPVQISHIKLSGNANWGRAADIVQRIEAARASGLEVAVDQYPYTASSTQLSVLLPDDVLDGGLPEARKKIADASTRATIVARMVANAKLRQRPSFAYAVVASYAADSSLNGKSIAAINLQRGRAPTLEQEAGTILELLAVGNAQMVLHGMDEADVRQFMRYPHNMVASDGSVQSGLGMPHPRSYGTHARVLGRYVREEKLLSLEEAVRRMTSLPAQHFQLKDRGLLKVGLAADIVIFDDKTVADRATFSDPHQFAAGIEAVIVNGQVVVEGGRHSGAKPGRALRGAGYRP